MSLPDFTIYGERLFRLAPDKPVEKALDIHTLNQRWQAPSRRQFRLGAAPPGWPNMRIVGVDPTEEIEEEAYELRLDCEGILDDREYLITSHEEELPEEGWDTINLTVYTRDHGNVAWRKGSRLQGDAPLYDIIGSAADSKLAHPEHGLLSSQVALVDFTAGFGGLTTGGSYYVARINANQFYLALSKANALAAGVTPPAAAHAITGSAVSHRIAWTAHGLTDGDVVTFPTLTGGAGLRVAVLPYYVINSTADDFQLALTPGGAAIAFTTNISAGTCQPGSAILLTSDGAGMTLRYVQPGYESCWIVERRKRKARAAGYWEIDLQLKGIKLGDDDSKPVKRRISTTTQTVSNDKFPGIIVGSVYLGFPPELVGTSSLGPPIPPGYQPTELDLPQIAVTDTFISDQPPPTVLVPGNWIPADAPPILILSPLSDSYTYHWPAGWKVLNLQSEQIPGQQLWFISITWGYQIPTSPRTSSDA